MLLFYFAILLILCSSLVILFHDSADRQSRSAIILPVKADGMHHQNRSHY